MQSIRFLTVPGYWLAFAGFLALVPVLPDAVDAVAEALGLAAIELAGLEGWIREWALGVLSAR